MKMPSTNFNLLLLMTSDLGRNLFKVFLFLTVIASALAVVLSAHHNRQLSIQHEKLVQEKDALDIEWRHLIIEQSALTEHNRIEQIVSKNLDMRRPGPDDEILVRGKPNGS
ncbi:cell division protein FtsL [Glaciecola sp. MH2013]|uniref:cell division protein FtsL n=1 Tax=Glaciecola sp. MH2013 TaxID=2785524 RepID=UPI00189D2DF2|nr:cell division protein FtsL [Glaciecola sp. MH2013]MBF7072037.1 cell division protein FtsL [Glaciecola sp. MH2013]